MSSTTFAGGVPMARENKNLAWCLLAVLTAILIGLLAAHPAWAISTFSVNDFVATRTVPVGQSITATATKFTTPSNTSEFTGEPRSVRSAP